MGIALGVTVYEPGAGGVPTTTNPIPLGGRIDDYEHSIAIEAGFDSMRCAFTATGLEEAVDWLNRLMASVVVTNPEAAVVWEGYLYAPPGG